MVDCDGEEQLKSCRKIQGNGGVAGWKTTIDLNSNFKGSDAGNMAANKNQPKEKLK